ncbi:MAG: GNAT family N-acetyltransferase [Candidatus Cloacimonetes bacterium]|nr:GNAT family N-acetyltransferase [Candidatus Cloacimonadota bacterium]
MKPRIIHCQKLDPELFAAITAIWRETGISNPARADSFDAVQHNLDHGGIMLLAWLDEALAGTAWLSHDFRRLYIHHMAVSPKLQNRGIGRALLEEALALARDRGWQAKLEVHRDNPAARHLYASCGFSDLEGYIVMIRRG